MEAPQTALKDAAAKINDERQAQQKASPGAAPPGLQAILARAKQGDQAALAELGEVLNNNPSIWQVHRDLIAVTERAWINRIAATDPLFTESIRRGLDQLKRDLCGPAPTAMDRILVDRIGICWLVVQQASLGEAFKDGGTGDKVATVRLRQLDSAHRRFISAVKSLAHVRRMTGGLKIEINHSMGAAAGPATSGASGRFSEAGDLSESTFPDANSARLNNLINQGLARERIGV